MHSEASQDINSNILKWKEVLEGKYFAEFDGEVMKDKIQVILVSSSSLLL